MEFLRNSVLICKSLTGKVEKDQINILSSYGVLTAEFFKNFNRKFFEKQLN